MSEVEEKEAGGRRSESIGGGGSEKILKEAAPMVLARWNTTAYKGNSVTRKLAEVLIEMETATISVMEEDFKHQKVIAKRDFTSGRMWEVDIGKEWISSRHQGIGKQVASDPPRKRIDEKY